MIRILFKDGETVTYKKKDYTDYIYDGKTFVVVNKRKWIGIYNLDTIICIEVGGKAKR